MLLRLPIFIPPIKPLSYYCKSSRMNNVTITYRHEQLLFFTAYKPVLAYF
jgi:hypothetical protein